MLDSVCFGCAPATVTFGETGDGRTDFKVDAVMPPVQGPARGNIELPYLPLCANYADAYCAFSGTAN
jgi:hypothetical protein